MSIDSFRVLFPILCSLSSKQNQIVNSNTIFTQADISHPSMLHEHILLVSDILFFVRHRVNALRRCNVNIKANVNLYVILKTSLCNHRNVRSYIYLIITFMLRGMIKMKMVLKICGIQNCSYIYQSCSGRFGMFVTFFEKNNILLFITVKVIVYLKPISDHK